MLICIGSESNQPSSQKITLKCKDTNLFRISCAVKCWMMEEQLWEVPLYAFLVFILFSGACYWLLLKRIYEDRIRRIFDGTWFRSLLLLCLWKAHSDLRLQCRFTTESLH